jgi:hypothetical protein
VDAQRDTLGDAHPTTCDSAMQVADLLRWQGRAVQVDSSLTQV